MRAAPFAEGFDQSGEHVHAASQILPVGTFEDAQGVSKLRPIASLQLLDRASRPIRRGGEQRPLDPLAIGWRNAIECVGRPGADGPDRLEQVVGDPERGSLLLGSAIDQPEDRLVDRRQADGSWSGFPPAVGQLDGELRLLAGPIFGSVGRRLDGQLARVHDVDHPRLPARQAVGAIAIGAEQERAVQIGREVELQLPLPPDMGMVAAIAVTPPRITSR